jgi:hypothetical protein
MKKNNNIVNYNVDKEIYGREYEARIKKTLKITSNIYPYSSKPAIQSICDSDHFTRRLATVLHQQSYNLKTANVDKIFDAQWLDNRNVIMGTKCNKVLTLLNSN